MGRQFLVTPAQCAENNILHTPTVYSRRSYAILETLHQTSAGGNYPGLCSGENLRTNIHR